MLESALRTNPISIRHYRANIQSAFGIRSSRPSELFRFRKGGLNNRASDRSHASSTPGASTPPPPLNRQDRRPVLNPELAKAAFNTRRWACLLQSPWRDEKSDSQSQVRLFGIFLNALTTQPIRPFPKRLLGQLFAIGRLLNIPDISNCMNGKQYLPADKGIRSACPLRLAFSPIAAQVESEPRIPENVSGRWKVL